MKRIVPNLQALATLMDSARALEAPVFAPGVWKDAEKQFAEAQRAVEQKKKEKNIQENIGREGDPWKMLSRRAKSPGCLWPNTWRRARPPIRIHQDPVLFREAINYTTADTGFAPRFREMLAVTATDPVDISPDRFAALRLQVRSQLKAVLRARDYAEFDLDRAFATVADVARAV